MRNVKNSFILNWNKSKVIVLISRITYKRIAEGYLYFKKIFNRGENEIIILKIISPKEAKKRHKKNRSEHYERSAYGEFLRETSGVEGRGSCYTNMSGFWLKAGQGD